MNKVKPIYMIIGYEYLDEKVNWGYYYSFEEAEQAVLNNVTDLHKDYYNLMLIEEIYPGLVGRCENVYFYEWDSKNKKYVGIDRPESFAHICNFFM